MLIQAVSIHVFIETAHKPADIGQSFMPEFNGFSGLILLCLGITLTELITLN